MVRRAVVVMWVIWVVLLAVYGPDYRYKYRHWPGQDLSFYGLFGALVPALVVIAAWWVTSARAPRRDQPRQ